MRKVVVVWAIVLALVPVLHGADKLRPTGTYSIAAFDPATGDFGVAVQSDYFAVGAVDVFAKAGVGAIATQCGQNSTYGPRGLELLEKGLSPEQVVAELIKAEKIPDWRQVGVVDAHGRSFVYTGKKCPEWKGGRYGPNYAVQGDIVAGEAVVVNMEKAFLNTAGTRDVPEAAPLAERLLAALDAAEAAGGDRRGRQAAALLVVRKPTRDDELDRYVDLRVDDNPEPLKELRRIYDLWERINLTQPRLKHAQDLARAGKADEARIERERALAPFERPVRANPNDAQALSTLADYLAMPVFGINDLPRALELAERAVKLAPNDIGPMDALAKVLVYSNLDLDRAIGLLERLIKLDLEGGPDDYRDLEAEAYFRKGNVAKAIEIETGVVQRNPDWSDAAESLKRFKAAQKP
jgi:uncharacterized Ntn-hydrolase superfamily protein